MANPTLQLHFGRGRATPPVSHSHNWPSGRIQNFLVKIGQKSYFLPIKTQKLILTLEWYYRSLYCRSNAIIWGFGVGGLSPPQVDTFSVSKLRYFPKNTRSCVENECCCPRTVKIPNVNFIFKNYLNNTRADWHGTSILIFIFQFYYSLIDFIQNYL